MKASSMGLSILMASQWDDNKFIQEMRHKTNIIAIVDVKIPV